MNVRNILSNSFIWLTVYVGMAFEKFPFSKLSSSQILEARIKQVNVIFFQLV